MLAMASPKTVGSFVLFRRCIHLRPSSSSHVPVPVSDRFLLYHNRIGSSFRRNDYTSCPRLLFDGSSRLRVRCVQNVEFSTVAPRRRTEEPRILDFDSGQGMHEIRGAFAQAQVRATFYPKFENEKSDQEIRLRMIDVVESGKGVLEVTLKHSGSLFMYAGNHGGAFAKNSYGNLYSAVGVFVLGRTLQEAWGTDATRKQREFNMYLEKNHLCISMELVTAVLGDHGQRPLKDYVVVTAVTDLSSKPRFYSTSDIIAFCRQWRLPTNHIWLFSSRKSAISFFTAYDALCEEGTATPVSRVLDEIADVSVPATKSHTEVQGEILEGLVARIVSTSSVRRLKEVLKDFPVLEVKGQKELRPTLREICASHKGNEDQQVKALLHAVGPSMCSDFSDWDAKLPDNSLFSKFITADPVDEMTSKLQEMIRLLRNRKMPARYPCRVKEFNRKEGKIECRLTIHILQDMVFRNYQKELRRSPGLWPLYRGFFVDISLFDDKNRASPVSYRHDSSNGIEDDVLADEVEHLMLKLKFLTYKLRTFLIRNGLSILFDTGFAAYRKYYLRLMDIWGTSPSKQQHLDQMLTEWAGYITKKCQGIKLEEREYLSEAELFLEKFAEKSLKNKQLVGAAADTIKTQHLFSNLAVQDDDDSFNIKPVSPVPSTKESTKAKGILVFFPGIPGCAKSALCKELLQHPGDIGNSRPVESLMGDLTKGRYWERLAQEQRRSPNAIWLADKNAPNEEVWITVSKICQSTNAIGVPIVPDSEGTSSNPFSLETLAVFLFRVLQRVDHPGNLDGNSENPGFVLLMFYNLYEGKTRVEFEEALVRRFGYVVKQPVLVADRPQMPAPVIGILTRGQELFQRHTIKHGKLESTKGAFRDEWARWEKRLREIFMGNADHLRAIQVPFETVVRRVREQLEAITKGDRPIHVAGEEEKTFHNIMYAALSVVPESVIGTLNKVSASDDKVKAYVTTRGIDRSLQKAHVTLAHKKSHGVPAVAVFGGLRGVSVPIQLTAFLYADNMCALEASIPKNENNISSHNDWPHITVWTAEGTRPKEANNLPKLVSQGLARRLDFSTPFVVTGVVELL